MAPSGETFVTRESNGRVWLHQPEGAGGAGSISESLVQRAVADHGFDQIDQDFESWAALDAFRRERAAKVTPEVIVDRDSLDLSDVRRLLAVGRRWSAQGQGPRARRLAIELLRVPAVRTDTDTHNTLVSFLEHLDAPRIVVAIQPLTEMQSLARERWNQIAA